MELGFSWSTTKDGAIRVARDGRQVSVIGGTAARRLRERLRQAADEAERQSLLAKAKGNYKRGNERR